MRILFITNDLIAGSVAHELVKEGHEVKLYIKEKARRGNLDNLVQKTGEWKNELSWVGKDGLIVFDDVGFGRTQDKLRKQGYIVFGGSELGDKLELDREYGQKIFADYGMKTVELKDFENMDDAVMYVKDHPRAWVIKQNGHAPKTLNYIGHFDDGRDAISVLKNYFQNRTVNKERITLHEKIVGVEIGVGRYFNGKDWVGPIEYNLEHKKFFPGDIGPTTSEMGTLAWYDDDESNRLYMETVARFKPYLQEINYRGDFEINCVVNESGVYPLEATTRMGSPIVHLQTEIHESHWGEFLFAIAKGESYDLKWNQGYGLVVVMAVPPFPYSKKMKDNLFYGMTIFFDDVSEKEFEHIHFEEVSVRSNYLENPEKGRYYISDSRGYVLYATGMGKTVEEAQKKVYDLAKKIIIPKVIYRNDIGNRFIFESNALLKKWGYNFRKTESNFLNFGKIFGIEFRRAVKVDEEKQG
ncbi:MAG: phosphoribosylglycinamide synthetase C domain-containing protein [Candidatus Taylorbacteria bacterium]